MTSRAGEVASSAEAERTSAATRMAERAAVGGRRALVAFPRFAASYGGHRTRRLSRLQAGAPALSHRAHRRGAPIWLALGPAPAPPPRTKKSLHVVVDRGRAGALRVRGRVLAPLQSVTVSMAAPPPPRLAHPALRGVRPARGAPTRSAPARASAPRDDVPLFSLAPAFTPTLEDVLCVRLVGMHRRRGGGRRSRAVARRPFSAPARAPKRLTLPNPPQSPLLATPSRHVGSFAARVVPLVSPNSASTLTRRTCTSTACRASRPPWTPAPAAPRRGKGPGRRLAEGERTSKDAGAR